MDEKAAAVCCSAELGWESRVCGLLESWHGEDKSPGNESVGTASGGSSRVGEGSRMREINSLRCADGVVARDAACSACKRRMMSAEAARSCSLAVRSSLQKFAGWTQISSELSGVARAELGGNSGSWCQKIS